MENVPSYRSHGRKIWTKFNKLRSYVFLTTCISFILWNFMTNWWNFLYIKVICNNFLGQKQIICELRIFCWFLGILQRVLVRFFVVAGNFQQVVTSCLVVFNSYLLFEFEVACKKLRCPIFWFDETRKKKKIKKKEIHVENVFIERFESDKNIFSTNRTANCGADNGKSSELGGQNRNARSMRVSHSNGKLR